MILSFCASSCIFANLYREYLTKPGNTVIPALNSRDVKLCHLAGDLCRKGRSTTSVKVLLRDRSIQANDRLMQLFSTRSCLSYPPGHFLGDSIDSFWSQLHPLRFAKLLHFLFQMCLYFGVKFRHECDVAQPFKSVSRMIVIQLVLLSERCCFLHFQLLFSADILYCLWSVWVPPIHIDPSKILHVRPCEIRQVFCLKGDGPSVVRAHSSKIRGRERCRTRIH